MKAKLVVSVPTKYMDFDSTHESLKGLSWQSRQALKWQTLPLIMVAMVVAFIITIAFFQSLSDEPITLTDLVVAMVCVSIAPVWALFDFAKDRHDRGLVVAALSRDIERLNMESE